jgi:hypothetical protein
LIFIHSRKVDAEPITTKHADVVVRAFENIYKRKILERPVSITFYSGSEFKGETKHYFEDQDIMVRYAETNRHRQVALVETKNKFIGSTLFNILNYYCNIGVIFDPVHHPRK